MNAQPFPIHFDPKFQTCSRVDRAWVFCPSNLLIELQVRSHVVSVPGEYSGDGNSFLVGAIEKLSKKLWTTSKNLDGDRKTLKNIENDRNNENIQKHRKYERYCKNIDLGQGRGQESIEKQKKHWIILKTPIGLGKHCKTNDLTLPHYGLGFRDHSPLVLSFGILPRCKRVNKPLPKLVCKHLDSERQVNLIVADCQVFSWSSHKQLDDFKICIREASKRVLWDIMHDENRLQSQRLAFGIVFRAMWNNCFKVAKKLLRVSQIAMVPLHIIGGKVCCKNFDHFGFASNVCHSASIGKNIGQLKGDIAAASSANAKKQFKSRLQIFKRQQAVFSPTGETPRVTGIRVSQEDGSSIILQDAAAVQTALEDYWVPAHSAKEMDLDKAAVVMKVHIQRNAWYFEFSSLELPAEEELVRAIKHTKHSAWGHDRILLCRL